MILNSSTDTASEGEEDGINTHQLPEEIVCQKLQVTEAQQKEIEKQTRGQADNPQWFRHKKGRITASKAKKFVGKGDIGTLVKDVIRIRKPKLTSIPAVKYGIDNEVVALEKYKLQKAAQGVNVTVNGCGLFVDLEFGQLAASPDGLITDPSEKDPHGLVEIKCIYSCRDISPKEAIEKKGSSSQFPLKAVGETIIMKENHSHYYQVQMQMGVTRRKWCDFVLFTKKDVEVLILRVNFDISFWEKVKEKLLDFHTMNIVPALVAQGFYKKGKK